MSRPKKATGYLAVVLMMAFSSAGWAYKRYPRGNVWNPIELAETKPLPSGSDSEFVAVRIDLPENKNDADTGAQSDDPPSEKHSTTSHDPASAEKPGDGLPEKKTAEPMTASDPVDHETSASPIIKEADTLDKNRPSAPQASPSGVPAAQAKKQFIHQKDKAMPAGADDNTAETPSNAMGTPSNAMETPSNAMETPTNMPEETNQHAESAQKQRIPSIEAGFWQIDRKSTVIAQGQAQSTAFQQDFVCYSEALIKQESEKGFMANWGVDALPGFSCKETQAPYQEGMQIVRQLTCQSEKGQQSLIVRYTLWLGGTWLNGLLEAGLQEGLFRLEIMGRRVGECPVEIRH